MPTVALDTGSDKPFMLIGTINRATAEQQFYRVFISINMIDGCS